MIVCVSLFLSTSSQTFVTICLLPGLRWYFSIAIICTLLTANAMEYFLTCVFLLLRRLYSEHCPSFNRITCLCEFFLFLVGSAHQSFINSANSSVGSLCTLLILSFDMQTFCLMRFYLQTFASVFYASGSYPEKYRLFQYFKNSSPMFFFPPWVFQELGFYI